MWRLMALGALAMACGEATAAAVRNGSGGTGGAVGLGGTTSLGGSGGAVPAEPRRPFAQHSTKYAASSQLPSGAQTALDGATRDFYDQWKKSYLTQGTAARCGVDRWYVAAGLDTDSSTLTLSEAHGYGMLISVIMAGHDPEAKAHFDGMVRFWRDHPSADSPVLMTWSEDQNCQNDANAKSSTDADLDIALALLMADEQWGSCGEIDYRAKALEVMQAIGSQEIDSTGNFLLVSNQVLLGDVVPWDRASRSSDFMPGHLASFANVGRAAGGDGAPWVNLMDAGFEMFGTLETRYAAATGLVPDVFVGPRDAPSPAPDPLDASGQALHYDEYFYNACRVPWRVGTYAVLSGDERGKNLLAAINSWIVGMTAGDPLRVVAGYQLDGTPLGADYAYPTMAFIAPLGVAAMTNPQDSVWLDAIWNDVVSFGSEGYYEDTLKLLSMLVTSGNWWAPSGAVAACNGQ
jgi:endoglucanase